MFQQPPGEPKKRKAYTRFLRNPPKRFHREAVSHLQHVQGVGRATRWTEALVRHYNWWQDGAKPDVDEPTIDWANPPDQGNEMVDDPSPQREATRSDDGREAPRPRLHSDYWDHDRDVIPDSFEALNPDTPGATPGQLPPSWEMMCTLIKKFDEASSQRSVALPAGVFSDMQAMHDLQQAQLGLLTEQITALQGEVQAQTQTEQRLKLAIRDLEATVAKLEAYLAQEHAKNEDLARQVHLSPHPHTFPRTCFTRRRLFSSPAYLPR
jgi:hypothetical protein